jgi:hypothetical protein
MWLQTTKFLGWLIFEPWLLALVEQYTSHASGSSLVSHGAALQEDAGRVVTISHLVELAFQSPSHSLAAASHIVHTSARLSNWPAEDAAASHGMSGREE